MREKSQQRVWVVVIKYACLARGHRAIQALLDCVVLHRASLVLGNLRVLLSGPFMHVGLDKTGALAKSSCVFVDCVFILAR